MGQLCHRRSARSGLRGGTECYGNSSESGGDLHNLKSCNIEYVERNETRSASHQSANEFHRHILMAPGRKLREEFQPGQVTVSNGTDVWRYNPQNREYTKRLGRSDRNPLPYQRFARSVASARVLREENLSVGGASVACYVIEASLAPPQRVQSGL
jgi:outer membrane lipoprotein-sorting protein